MTIPEQIEAYLTSQPQAKRTDLRALHALMLQAIPGGKLWFEDGKNSEGKVVSNPSIGYGTRTTTYADGKTKEYYQAGLSANTSGISVYILGIADKAYLAETYGKTLGKATVTGYCIKFKKLADIDVEVLEAAVKDGVGMTGEN
ncbi:DUF1801 domain-containing protein [Mucilaginibacter terrenus]|uniref:DUF1801 domain-containing protein n=1 Tax=Mucilaginibacter terrenus TaxID=2482727 RepID=A0A3E2NLK9_9SPHI|nr:DUF1801 domain-containing protein [Mucilaginibacter terrenus]RFZ81823.1 DUF1801 domain-containing protein [Mucilaginibacter terrenus]